MDIPKITESSSILTFSKNKTILLWILLWTVLGIMQTFRLYYAYNVFDEGIITWQKSAIWAFAEWYLWGILSIIIVKAINWLQNNGKNLRIKIISFIIGLIVIPPVHLYLYSLIWWMTKNIYKAPIGTSYQSFNDVFLGSYLGKVNDNSITYFLIVAAVYALNYYRRLYREQNRVTEMNRMLAETRLESLRTQLHPHFLFNALNSITTLIHTDPDRADLMITKLSDLLRISLDNNPAHVIPLKEEMHFLKQYLELQQIRFEDRLAVAIDIENGTENALVPNLLLQPLVENAIKHGIAVSSAQGHIEIKNRRKENDMIITIFNTGPALNNFTSLDDLSGVGLKNTLQRLRQMYNDRAELTLKNLENEGVYVSVRIPFQVKEQ